MVAKKQLIMLPGPTNLHPRVMEALSKPIINHRGPGFHELHDRVLEKVKYVFQTENDVFVLTSSGTGGVECILGNTLSPGDEVVVPVYGEFSHRLKEKIEAFGGAPIEVPAEWGKAATAEQIESAIEGHDVKAVAVVYNETSTGVKVPDLRKIGEVAKKHDALFMVDAISILGGDELPVDEWGVDLCVTGSQKCLACPPGLALISVSERAWETIGQTKPRTFYFNLPRMKEYQKRKETPFTPAVHLWYALDEAITMIQEEGLEKRIERHRECARLFYDALMGLKLELFADERWRSNTVIAVRNPPGVPDTELRRLMREKHGVVIAGGMGKLKGETFRIGNMGIVSKREVTMTIDALRDALSELGALKL
jgi:aspartate aminotransferase-like enzyme